ncbi:MAG: hypothetical protein M1819_002548 [Sarea resinae]|nr:MAG: hypothetical protein M1819_002548 [Sarea resinae]
MQLAEILSDLTSLRVCGHDEALALVNAHKTLSPSTLSSSAPPPPPSSSASPSSSFSSSTGLAIPASPTTSKSTPADQTAKTPHPHPHPHPQPTTKPITSKDDTTDPDLRRATDLVDLHYAVKVKHRSGRDAELEAARHDVRRALSGLHGT